MSHAHHCILRASGELFEDKARLHPQGVGRGAHSRTPHMSVFPRFTECTRHVSVTCANEAPFEGLVVNTAFVIGDCNGDGVCYG